MAICDNMGRDLCESNIKKVITNSGMWGNAVIKRDKAKIVFGLDFFRHHHHEHRLSCLSITEHRFGSPIANTLQERHQESTTCTFLRRLLAVVGGW